MKTTEQKLLSNEEIASFCNQAAMLFQAGIPPVEGMAILQSDAQSPEGDLRPDPYRMPAGRKFSQGSGSHGSISRLLSAYDRSGRGIR